MVLLLGLLSALPLEVQTNALVTLPGVRPSPADLLIARLEAPA